MGLAKIRERQGRTDEAIALSRAGSTRLLNNREELAALLARHARLGELRAAAATDDAGYAVQELANLLEERGDVEGAIAAYRPCDGTAAHNRNSALELAQFLARHGRGDEAIDVMRVQADARKGDDWILRTLSDLCLAQGRPEADLAHLDVIAAARGGEEDWELYWIRLPLIAARDGIDEAIAQARSHPRATAGTRHHTLPNSSQAPDAPKGPLLSCAATPPQTEATWPATSLTSAASRRPLRSFTRPRLVR
ncbi:tetratricopeptide repeat protein [Streptomyces fagopyri]|uniref:tetratricopeptide repeat protein n=1 Tax=Streptomyces fagopyri TaxID=2662397 RepID=UPI00381E6195